MKELDERSILFDVSLQFLKTAPRRFGVYAPAGTARQHRFRWLATSRSTVPRQENSLLCLNNLRRRRAFRRRLCQQSRLDPKVSAQACARPGMDPPWGLPDFRCPGCCIVMNCHSRFRSETISPPAWASPSSLHSPGMTVC